MSEFVNPRLHGADADIIVGINLLEAFGFRFRGDELPLKSRRSLDHGLALLLDVDRRVLARELAEILLRRFQIQTNGFQPLLQKDALPSCRRGAQFRDKPIEFDDVGFAQCG